jgi:hypothetical protein
MPFPFLYYTPLRLELHLPLDLSYANLKAHYRRASIASKLLPIITANSSMVVIFLFMHKILFFHSAMSKSF